MYIVRQQAEVTSGIFDVPLPLNPMHRTLVEIFNTWHEKYFIPLNPTRAFVIPTLLMIFRLLYTIIIYKPMFFAKLIAVAVGGLIIQCLWNI